MDAVREVEAWVRWWAGLVLVEHPATPRPASRGVVALLGWVTSEPQLGWWAGHGDEGLVVGLADDLVRLTRQLRAVTVDPTDKHRHFPLPGRTCETPVWGIDGRVLQCDAPLVVRLPRGGGAGSRVVCGDGHQAPVKWAELARYTRGAAA